MAKPTTEKTKPESVITFTINEIYTVPGTNKFTVNASSSDAEVKTVHIEVDMQTYIDGLTGGVVDGVNDFFKEVIGEALEVLPVNIVGDIISQTP